MQNDTGLVGRCRGGRTFQFHALELQANLFASEIILPDQVFRLAVQVDCRRLQMRDIGFGYVYVDDKHGTTNLTTS